MHTFGEIKVSPVQDFYDQDSEIKYFLDMYTKAIKQKDLEVFLAMCSDEIRCYDLMTPFQYQGIEVLKKRMKEWFASYAGDIDYTFHSLNIKSNATIALCHGLANTAGKMTDGRHVDMWTRVTICMALENTEWRIFHNHTSEPFDLESMKAVSNLQ